MWEKIYIYISGRFDGPIRSLSPQKTFASHKFSPCSIRRYVYKSKVKYNSSTLTEHECPFSNKTGYLCHRSQPGDLSLQDGLGSGVSRTLGRAFCTILVHAVEPEVLSHAALYRKTLPCPPQLTLNLHEKRSRIILNMLYIKKSCKLCYEEHMHRLTSLLRKQ